MASESATDGAEAAELRLGWCTDNDHCDALYRYVRGALDAESLSYEDVFYPLRHHHGEIAHRVDLETLTYWVRWGSGDYLYAMGTAHGHASDVHRATRADAKGMYRLCIENGLTPVLLAESPLGGDPDEYFAESPTEWDEKNAGGGDGG